MTTTAPHMCTHLSSDIRPRHSSIPVAATCTSFETKAPSWHQPSLSNSFPTIRPSRIAGLTLLPRGTAPTSSNDHGRLAGVCAIRPSAVDLNFHSGEKYETYEAHRRDRRFRIDRLDAERS